MCSDVEPVTMRRHREEMQVNVAGLRRNIKNLAHNYSDAQVKVREATSNDPWGPSSTLMSEIADLTYNVVAFSEIMQMVWKRLNDHGKNWRHVYKALVLLEYLIKTGSEKVGQQCKENIYAIQTLKDFQYYEEIKDQGINVREKAKHLVTLLKDEERLKNERAKALKAKERFAQTASGFGSDGTVETITLSTPSSPVVRRYQGNWSGSSERPFNAEPPSKELENTRPQTVGEEELQLQLALAMSREEAEQEEQRRKSDDVRLQLALSQSQHEFKTSSPPPQNASHMLDLLDVNLGSTASADPGLDPWGVPHRPPQRPQADPWSSSMSNPSPSVVDPWAPVSHPHPRSTPVADPWRPSSPPSRPPPVDPWSPNTDHSSPLDGHISSPSDLDDFDIITNREKTVNGSGLLNMNHGASSPDPFDLGGVSNGLVDLKPNKKSPHSFLGENSSLVNLDNLVTVGARSSPSSQPVPPLSGAMANPFAGMPPHAIQPSATIPPQNLFQQQIPPRPSMNQIRQQPAFTEDTLPSPLTPAANPFLS